MWPWQPVRDILDSTSNLPQEVVSSNKHSADGWSAGKGTAGLERELQQTREPGRSVGGGAFHRTREVCPHDTEVHPARGRATTAYRRGGGRCTRPPLPPLRPAARH